MIYLNILYFLIITWYGYKFLKSDGQIVRSPFDKEQHYKFSGPEMFWTLTFSTGLLAFSAPLPIDLMAVRLLVIMILCFIGFGVVADKPIWSMPLKLYVVYLLWLLIGCSYSPSVSYGFRVILKYSYPLVFCLFASAAADNFIVAYKASIMARSVALLTVIISFVPLVELLIPGVIWYGTARAIHYISIMTFSIALFFFTSEKKKNFWYAVLFLLPCFLWVFRTSIMGSGVAIMAFAIIRWRLRSLPVIVGVLIAGVVAVFTIPSLREKMFNKGAENVTIENFQSGGLSMEDVETNAREAMWSLLEHELYDGYEITGSGTGSVQQYMYNHFIFGGLKVPHSDFVQIKCDNGLIGLYLYIGIVLMIFLHCFKIYWSTTDDRIRIFAITAGASMLGVFATLYSDNTVNYSMATLSMPYGFYGMTLALNKKIALE
ncbi:MAG: O-antigen ligase family protein [Muribaculaceae bacterium]|nr:O-antigen ligase family protein [Muribaculaceae bacterium]